jgi:hypothetical protein
MNMNMDEVDVFLGLMSGVLTLLAFAIWWVFYMTQKHSEWRRAVENLAGLYALDRTLDLLERRRWMREALASRGVRHRYDLGMMLAAVEAVLQARKRQVR